MNLMDFYLLLNDFYAYFFTHFKCMAELEGTGIALFSLLVPAK